MLERYIPTFWGWLRTDWAAYAVLSLLIMGPLLLPGYIFTLDMAWGPVRPLPSEPSNVWPLYFVLSWLSWLPSQQLILLAIFGLAGLGAHRLAQQATGPALGHMAYLAGLFYAVNPFIYSRFVAGQWLVLVGYALLPWLIGAYWRLLQAPDWRRAVIALAWTLAVALTSLHSFGFVPLVVLVLLLASGWRRWRRKLGWLSLISLATLLVNSFWLWPTLSGSSRLAASLAGFDLSQMKAFATEPTVLNSVPLTAALLSGFWADSFGRYMLPQAVPWWGLLATLLLAVIGIGAWRIICRRDRLGLALLGLGLAAWLLAMGVAWPGTAWLAQWLAAEIPFYAGYREPQKWLALLALAYAYSLAQAGRWLLARHWLGRRPNWRSATTASLLALPLLWTPMQLLAAGGQLRASQYPAGWRTVRESLLYAGATRSTNIVVLPWHMYTGTKFTGRVGPNPAPFYFSQRMIVSNNPELRGVPFEPGTAIQNYVNQELLPSRGQAPNSTRDLKALGVDYILLIKEADWQRYQWLATMDGLSRVEQNSDATLYAIEPPSDN